MKAKNEGGVMKMESEAKAIYDLLMEIENTELNADVIRILTPWFERIEIVLGRIEASQ